MQQQSAVTQDELLAPAPDAGVFSVLDDVECSSLLHDGVIGRVAFADPDLAILPVTYDWVDGVVVFRTSPSSSLERPTGISQAKLTRNMTTEARAPATEEMRMSRL